MCVIFPCIISILKKMNLNEKKRYRPVFCFIDETREYLVG